MIDQMATLIKNTNNIKYHGAEYISLIVFNDSTLLITRYKFVVQHLLNCLFNIAKLFG